MPRERLQKILASAGFGSRRSCEELIAAGRVRVNGEIAGLGDKADRAVDEITLDGERVAAEQLVYVILHKPRGVVSSLNAQGDRRTVRDLVPVPGRLYPVGRLDADSEGLILLTNDGNLTHRLTHPRYGQEKEYLVLVTNRPDRDALEAWHRGLIIYDEESRPERTGPAKVEIDSSRKSGEGTWLRVTMREGKKHEIRRVGATLGLRVLRILRVGLGALRLGNLKAGEWRYLTEAEVRALRGTTGKQESIRQIRQIRGRESAVTNSSSRARRAGRPPEKKRRGRAK
ncbi:MAG: rRNA pseudouridine synthase [Chloroflexi bacterium]|nr:rRNA pseudouridine synthase [Chloroflexota bacterium]MBI3760974.1 rRNA pseudouridine synthase [Chloroflexota bacterium]